MTLGCFIRSQPLFRRDSFFRASDVADAPGSSLFFEDSPASQRAYDRHYAAFSENGDLIIVRGAASLSHRFPGDGTLDGCHVVAAVAWDGIKYGCSPAGFGVEPPEEAIGHLPDTTIVSAGAVADADIADEAQRPQNQSNVASLAPRSGAT